MNDTPPTPGNPGTGFSDQWNKLFGEVDTSNQGNFEMMQFLTNFRSTVRVSLKPNSYIYHIIKDQVFVAYSLGPTVWC